MRIGPSSAPQLWRFFQISTFIIRSRHSKSNSKNSASVDNNYQDCKLLPMLGGLPVCCNRIFIQLRSNWLVCSQAEMIPSGILANLLMCCESDRIMSLLGSVSHFDECKFVWLLYNHWDIEECILLDGETNRYCIWYNVNVNADSSGRLILLVLNGIKYSLNYTLIKCLQVSRLDK